MDATKQRAKTFKREYSIRVTVYKTILDLQAFQGASFIPTTTEFARHDNPRVVLTTGNQQHAFVRSASGVRASVSKGKSKLLRNPFFLPVGLVKNTVKQISELATANDNDQEVALTTLDDEQTPLTLGIDSADYRTTLDISAQQMRASPSMLLHVNLAYSMNSLDKGQKYLFGTGCKIDVTSMIKEWMREESQNNFARGTVSGEIAPWSAYRYLVVPILKNNVERNFSQVVKQLGNSAQVLSENDGLFQNKMGFVFLRVDLVNLAQVKRERGEMLPLLHVESTLEEVMVGNYGGPLVNKFVEIYKQQGIVDASSLPGGLSYAIDSLGILCPPTSFTSLITLNASISANPVTTSLGSLKLVKKRVASADRSTKLKWKEVGEEVEELVCSYLDKFPDFPISPEVGKQKEKILSEVPPLLIQVGSIQVASHPVYQDHINYRWTKSHQFKFFGKRPFFLPQKKKMFPIDHCTSPKCSFMGQLIAYLLLVISLTVPFIVRPSHNVYFNKFIVDTLLTGYTDISNAEAFWNWLTVFGDNFWTDDLDRAGYLTPTDPVTIRQFRVPPVPCFPNTSGIAIKCYPDISFNLTFQPNWIVGGTYKNTSWNDILGQPVSDSNFLNNFLGQRYPKGGFGANFSTLDNFKQTMAVWKNQTWYDAATRAIIISFAVYNSNSEIWGYCTLLIEVTASGSVVPSFTFQFMTLSELNNEMISSRDGFDVFTPLVFFLVFAFLFLEVREILNSGLKDYLLDFWNYSDVLFLLGTFIVVCLKFALPPASERDVFKNELIVILGQYNFAYTRRIIGAFFTFWSWIRLMQYARSSKRLAPLIVSVKSMIVNDVAVFIMLAFVIITGFAIILMQVTGNSLSDYKDVGSSLFTLLKAALGGVDFPDFGSNGPSLAQTLGSVMVGIYGIAMVILLVNLLIAMMGNTYDAIGEQAEGHWALAFTQTLIYYEKAVWVPPLNLLYEAISLVIFMADRLTCGKFSKFGGLENEDLVGSITRPSQGRNDVHEPEGDTEGGGVTITPEFLALILQDSEQDKDEESQEEEKPKRRKTKATKKESQEEKDEDSDEDDDADNEDNDYKKKLETYTPPKATEFHNSRQRQPDKPTHQRNYRFTRALNNPFWDD